MGVIVLTDSEPIGAQHGNAAGLALCIRVELEAASVLKLIRAVVELSG